MVHTKNTGTVFARRATRRKRILLLQLADFNPHLTQRVTGAAIFASTTSWNFNPHPHAEGDAGASFESMHMAQFQSTSSHGGWPEFLPEDKGLHVISIHILTRRMTERNAFYADDRWNFNPHPHTEDDTCLPKSRGKMTDFNPHPHTEDDMEWLIFGPRLFYFNPHPHTEDD